MRVIAGKAKGHRLKLPKGAIVRPATSLVRGAIFSILETTANDWSQVLDLFSGSGSLGIEALSRGAGWVDFVDIDPRCCAMIKQNLAKAKLTERSRIYCYSVVRALSSLDKEYSIILMDPPYSDSSIGDFIGQLATSKLVGASSIMVVTHSSHLTLHPTYASLNLIKERRYGDSCVAVYQNEGRL